MWMQRIVQDSQSLCDSAKAPPTVALVPPLLLRLQAICRGEEDACLELGALIPEFWVSSLFIWHSSPDTQQKRFCPPCPQDI